MASIQSEDQDNISLTSAFNTAQSSITDTESPYTSNIHEHCRTRRLDEPERKGRALIYYCKYCESGSATSTTGLRSHIRTRHKDIQLEDARPTLAVASIAQVAALYERLYEQGQTSKFDLLVLNRTINTKLVFQALVDLIVVRRLPLRIVEWPEFHRFCTTLNPSSLAKLPSSHHTIKKRIDETFPEAKDIVRRTIQSAKTPYPSCCRYLDISKQLPFPSYLCKLCRPYRPISQYSYWSSYNTRPQRWTPVVSLASSPWRIRLYKVNWNNCRRQFWYKRYTLSYDLSISCRTVPDWLECLSKSYSLPGTYPKPCCTSISL